MFDMLTDDFAAGSDYVGDRAPAEIRAQAHSAAAQAYWDEWCLDTDEARADDHAELHRFGRPFNPAGESPYAPLVFAAVHASHSVQLGLVSPAVLWVGFGVKDVVERIRGTDVQVTSTGEEVDWALEFRPLWDALKKRESEIVAEERRRRAKVAKNPGAYICAAEGCNVEGLHKAALRACGGGCPADLKPHYCSKECQKRVCRFARVVLTVTYLVPAGLAETQGGMQARAAGQNTHHRRPREERAVVAQFSGPSQQP